MLQVISSQCFTVVLSKKHLFSKINSLFHRLSRESKITMGEVKDRTPKWSGHVVPDWICHMSSRNYIHIPVPKIGIPKIYILFAFLHMIPAIQT